MRSTDSHRLGRSIALLAILAATVPATLPGAASAARSDDGGLNEDRLQGTTLGPAYCPTRPGGPQPTSPSSPPLADKVIDIVYCMVGP